ncbi:hypothetical protein A2930_00960 [Candidatus Giovannonibacteria bacterium RIFCSPLOWO2_01_FULL_45_34]|uniref:Uncharacterized protein n=1 Tax=Candidatus Giovannonibacteria bacterium RIFCSPLOWO2_01_FULL_45_34 TaxID=1798351 RepID=A0A1F5WZ49_9BACT|nr:MAG: hypothetical protein A3C73_00410 [Candidatus Giovannonibacteria bacterium RIFCSPHIGHO2_02_FULL_44_11]OGF80581.1 MAG: hypothetical protein A2930_00960 [Candidatus Giovannonibacteria bacterium RIFCSPLOWO2_01_FULL_45_34]
MKVIRMIVVGNNYEEIEVRDFGPFKNERVALKKLKAHNWISFGKESFVPGGWHGPNISARIVSTPEPSKNLPKWEKHKGISIGP